MDFETIKRVIGQFHAVEHRIEYVAEKKGVVYYNDSKGTNPDAAIQGIKAMSRPTILIGGGYDKQSEYDEWIESSFICDENLILRLSDDAHIKSEWFVEIEEL